MHIAIILFSFILLFFYSPKYKINIFPALVEKDDDVDVVDWRGGEGRQVMRKENLNINRQQTNMFKHLSKHTLQQVMGSKQHFKCMGVAG